MTSPQWNDMEPSVPLPRGWTRRLIGAGILLFLISQIAIPLSYYFGDEPTSERFAWRMFSSIDLSTWDAHVFATMEQNGAMAQQEIPLEVYLQESFVKAVQKAQLDIIEAFMRRLCQQPGVREVRFEAFGKLPSGKAMAPVRLLLRRGDQHVRRVTL